MGKGGRGRKDPQRVKGGKKAARTRKRKKRRK